MINQDLSSPVVASSAEMEWSSSPSVHVLRKRFFLRGPEEAGQVTSLVRYLPGARFRAHGHPDGEEILVLEGVFTDQTGDWPAGSWLANPEGFRHAPSSVPGCLLFVKLRQYTGREHKAIRLDDFGWQRLENRVLDKRPGGRTRVLAMGPGDRLDTGDAGMEGFVLDGRARVLGRELQPHDWFRLPPGAGAAVESAGCSLYVDEDSVVRLAAGQDTQITSGEGP